MPIDIQAETVIKLSEATSLVPRLRRGRETHVSTLHRWASRGLRGVQLETLQVGGTRCTSREALQRFFEALSERSPTSKARTSASAAAERAAEQLDQLGIGSPTGSDRGHPGTAQRARPRKQSHRGS